MKKICLVLFLLFPFVAGAQEVKIASLFRAMPDSILPLLTTNNRLDFIDYLENNMQARVRNRFDETAEMTVLTDNYLHIQLSPVSEVEMRLLSQPDTLGPLVCVLRSYSALARETTVEFYDQSWNRQYWIDTPAPSASDYLSLVPDSLQKERSQAVAELSDMPLWSVTASQDSEEFDYDLQLSLLPRDLREKLSSYVSSLKYQWNGTSFDLKK